MISINYSQDVTLIHKYLPDKEKGLTWRFSIYMHTVLNNKNFLS